MTAHGVVIEVELDPRSEAGLASGCRYRWYCSCASAGRWHEASRKGYGAAVRAARRGGIRHAAAMERRAADRGPRGLQ